MSSEEVMDEKVKHTRTPYEYSANNWRNEPDPWNFYITGDLFEHPPDEDDGSVVTTAIPVAIAVGNPTGREVAEATAKFIVKACNAHDELLAACKTALLACELLNGQSIIYEAMEYLRAAIAQAEGK